MNVTMEIRMLPITMAAMIPNSENPRKSETARIKRAKAVVNPETSTEGPVFRYASTSAAERGLSTSSCSTRLTRWIA